mmetsp:Transcript_15526/g.33485  ORF Transcript_15526/g.33485 Transcript_15526/m.33485 type:complete len:500 (-) Transcript_15526:156-1655(-)
MTWTRRNETVVVLDDTDSIENMRCTTNTASSILAGKLGVVITVFILAAVMVSSGGSSVASNPFVAAAREEFGTELRRMQALSFPDTLVDAAEGSELHRENIIGSRVQQSAETKRPVVRLLPLEDPADFESELAQAKRVLHEANSNLLEVREAVRELFEERKARSGKVNLEDFDRENAELVEKLAQHLTSLQSEMTASHRRLLIEHMLENIIEPTKRTLDFWEYPESLKSGVENIESGVLRSIEELHFFRTEDAVLVARVALLGIGLGVVCVAIASMLVVGKRMPWEVLASVNVLNAWALFQLFIAKVVFDNDVLVHAYYHHRFALGLLQAAAIAQLPVVFVSIASFVLFCKTQRDQTSFRLSVAYAVQFVWYFCGLVYAAETMYHCRTPTSGPCKLSVPVLTIMLLCQASMLLTLLLISLPKRVPSKSNGLYYEKANADIEFVDLEDPKKPLSRCSSITEELILASAYGIDTNPDELTAPSPEPIRVESVHLAGDERTQ